MADIMETRLLSKLQYCNDNYQLAWYKHIIVN